MANTENITPPPDNVVKALQKLASQTPPPSIIFEARKICDKLGLKYDVTAPK